MIVRINQLDVRRADGVAGWEPNEADPRAPLHCEWPADTQAVQVLVLDVDEMQQMMGLEFRRKQIRKLIPDVCVALAEERQMLVARVDGPVSEAEIFSIFRFISDAQAGRFAVSGFQRLDEESPSPFTSIRSSVTVDRLRQIASDPQLGLERETRLRIFAVPVDLINPLIDIADVEDERWSEILHAAEFILTTTRGGESLVVHTRKFAPADVKVRMTKQLLGEK